LLDTHVWLWWSMGSARIDAKTRALFDERANVLMLSAASAWEIAIKHRIGRLALPDIPERFIPAQLALQSIAPLDITVEHASTTAQLPLHHTDPFDRLLIAQARCENLTLVTADSALEPYAVARLRI